MSLNVETGTGSATSESYISVADATTYHANRGNSTWSMLTTAQMEEALRRATDYMVQAYRLRWGGYRVNSTQALDWPRNYVVRTDFQASTINGYQTISGNYYYPNNEVPPEVKNACAELALRAAAGELLPDLSQGVVREKVDVLEVEYDKYSQQSPRYAAIDRLLMPFFSGSSTSRTVVRA